MLTAVGTVLTNLVVKAKIWLGARVPFKYITTTVDTLGSILGPCKLLHLRSSPKGEVMTEELWRSRTQAPVAPSNRRPAVLQDAPLIAGWHARLTTLVRTRLYAKSYVERILFGSMLTSLRPVSAYGRFIEGISHTLV